MNSDRIRQSTIGLAALALAAPAHAADNLELLPELPAPIADAIGAPQGWGLIILIVLFALLVFPVNRLVFKPIFRVLDERDEKTAGTRARAEQLERETDEVLGRYEAQVAEARAEAEQQRRALLEAARGDASGTTGSARSEAEGQIENARSEIGAALESARAGLRAQSEELARQAAARVLGRPL